MSLNANDTEGFMDFEHMLMQFFGDKEYRSQDARQSSKQVRQKLQKVMTKVEVELLALDTTVRHKSMMLSDVERVKKDLGAKSPDYLTISIHLLSLVSRLLGFDYLKYKLNTPTYHQTASQYYSQIIAEGGDVIQQYYDQKTILGEQKDLIDVLKKQGKTRFRIAQILNTTEYQIKKIEREL